MDGASSPEAEKQRQHWVLFYSSRVLTRPRSHTQCWSSAPRPQILGIFFNRSLLPSPPIVYGLLITIRRSVDLSLAVRAKAGMITPATSSACARRIAFILYFITRGEPSQTRGQKMGRHETMRLLLLLLRPKCQGQLNNNAKAEVNRDGERGRGVAA